MVSKLKPKALQVAGWGLLHGDFFDLYDAVEHLQMPVEMAGQVIVYLRSLSYVETMAETRRCKREPGRVSTHRVFIKVLCIHPEPSPRPVKVPVTSKSDLIQQQLSRLVKAMPSPRRVR